MTTLGFTVTLTNDKEKPLNRVHGSVQVTSSKKFEEVFRQVARMTGMCSYCGAINDHIKRECPKQRQDRSLADRNGLCRFCLGGGHFERECPERPTRAPTTSPQIYSRGPAGRADGNRW